MSDHKLNIDIQKMAIAIQALKAQVQIIEDIITEALLKENENE